MALSRDTFSSKDSLWNPGWLWNQSWFTLVHQRVKFSPKCLKIKGFFSIFTVVKPCCGRRLWHLGYSEPWEEPGSYCRCELGWPVSKHGQVAIPFWVLAQLNRGSTWVALPVLSKPCSRQAQARSMVSWQPVGLQHMACFKACSLEARGSYFPAST